MKKLFLSLLVILFLISPRLTYAQEIAPEEVMEIENQVEPSPEPVQDVLTTEEAEIIKASSSAEVTTDTTINQTNDTTLDTNIAAVADTGNNSSQDTIGTTEIHTGDAATRVDITNNINTNIAGSNYVVDQVNVTQNSDENIDLSSHPLQCLMPSGMLLEFLQENNISFRQFLEVIQANNASILNDINLRALTGNNSASSIGDTRITTGDADVNVNISNIANTNLVGDCFYFAVINIYADQNGDIILPYELSVVDSSSSPSVYKTNAILDQSESVDQQNTADIKNTLNLSANTGSNTGGQSIKTGNATTQTTTINRANRNIYGNNWIRLDINTFGTWSGALINWLFANNFIQLANASESSTSTNSTQLLTNSTIQQTNNATIRNNITGLADTGNNTAQSNHVGQSSITTGNASVSVNLFNMLNTNIIGNNWYYLLLNIFGNFNGNIIFARPDLGIYGFTNKNIVYNGEDFWISLAYVSQGIIGAKNSQVRVQIPSMIDVLDITKGGVLDGNSILWNLGDLPKGTVGSMMLRAKIKDDNTLSSLFNLPISISTSMVENTLANNSFFIPFYIRSRTIGAGGSETLTSSSPLSTPSTTDTTGNLIAPLPVQPTQINSTNYTSYDTHAYNANFPISQPILDTFPLSRAVSTTTVTPIQNLILLSLLIVLVLARRLFI